MTHYGSINSRKMKRLVLLFGILIGIGSNTFAQKSTLNWVQETRDAAWQARDFQGQYVDIGRMVYATIS